MPDIPSIIERVAMALYARWPYTEQIEDPGGRLVVVATLWAKLSPEMRTRFHDDARAVLAAMREPTEGMVKAADKSDYDSSEDVPMSSLGIDFAIPWRAAIDAALAEEGR